MAVQVSPKLQSEITDLIATGDYAAAEDVIERGVHLLLEVRRREQLIASVDEAFASIDRGEGHVLTPELWDEIVLEGSRKAHSDEPLDPDVCA
jgi:Arc/MetJ-type ribon-helix-helix transcriptional regulator